MVGGNIAGKTRVLTTSVVLETSIAHLDVALQLGLILLVISLVTAFGLQLVQFVRLFERSGLGSEQFNEEFIDSFNVSWDELTVEKRGKKIIDSCSLDLFGNEIVALMGESGSGKSTLLRAMCGLENEPNPSTSDIAYVSQNPVLVMDTVAMELELPSKLHNELANAGQYFASLCGFEDRGGQRTDSLSGGEIQRLAFLRALSMNRKILILDEVTSELDGVSIERIEKQIISFKERGGAVLLATHNPQQAKRLADRILYIHEGSLIANDHEVAEQLRTGQRIG